MNHNDFEVGAVLTGILSQNCHFPNGIAILHEPETSRVWPEHPPE